MSWDSPVAWAWIKPAVTVLLLAGLWSWETVHPFFPGRKGRLRHASRNLVIAVSNTVMLSLVFGGATVAVCQWGTDRGLGLLHRIELALPLRMFLAVVLLDGWLYAWHRANHHIPFLWRFHRMHHADRDMDVTTATRFHLGEHVGSSILRLGLIPLLGLEVSQLLVYETLVVASTMFHHANISVGRADVVLRSLFVTPFMHKVHHSRWQPETNSNYSTVFSFWDRLFCSYRVRDDCTTIELGLQEFDDPRWQTVAGMFQTPLAFPMPDPPDKGNSHDGAA